MPRLDIYNLSERAELRDNVAKLYRKSLLYLVSRALERDKDKPILGMRLYSKELKPRAGLNLIYSDGRGQVTVVQILDLLGREPIPQFLQLRYQVAADLPSQLLQLLVLGPK